MALSFPASPSNGDVYTNTTTGVKYIYNATDGVWKTQVFPTNTDYLQLTGGTLTGNLSLGTNDLTAQDINSTTLTTTGAVTVGNGLTVSAGNVVMSSGAGIDFSATADGSGTMSNELFDDYEEGTWAPTVTSGVTSPTYTSTAGNYTKIGNTVFFTFRMQVSGGTNNGDQVIISGLPFASSSTKWEGGGTFSYSGNLTGSTLNLPTMYIGRGSTTIDLYSPDSTTWLGNEGNGWASAARSYHIKGHYFV